jgi:hypothetical protein
LDRNRDDQNRLKDEIKRLLLLKDPSKVQKQAQGQQQQHTHCGSATTNNTNNDVNVNDQIDRLFDWATRRKGALLDGICSGKDEHGGRGLFASRAVSAKGGILAVLPRELRIGQNLACQRVAGGGLLPVNTPDLTALSLLVLAFLADARASSPNTSQEAVTDADEDNWSVFVGSFPRRRSEFTNAVLMTNEEVEAWSQRQLHGGMEYATAILGVRKTAESCVRYIHEVLLDTNTDANHQDSIELNEEDGAFLHDDSAIYWAIAMVLSRTHAFGATTGCRWMTPVFDLANHSPNANCRLEGDDQGRLLLKSERAIACGEEVTLDYQVHDDAKLVATYGFSLVHPPLASACIN